MKLMKLLIEDAEIDDIKLSRIVTGYFEFVEKQYLTVTPEISLKNVIIKQYNHYTGPAPDSDVVMTPFGEICTLDEPEDCCDADISTYPNRLEDLKDLEDVDPSEDYILTVKEQSKLIF